MTQKWEEEKWRTGRRGTLLLFINWKLWKRRSVKEQGRHEPSITSTPSSDGLMEA